MNILVISGSPRQQASSLNVAKYTQQQLSKLENVQSSLLDLHQLDLPLWSSHAVADESTKQLIAEADGFVFVVPEWHGMVPPAFKNLFYYFNGFFAHKPAYIIGVSSGTGGRYPITELRSSTYKNSFINYTPISTVIDHVDNTFNEHGEFIAETDYIAQRMDEGMQFLSAYSKALMTVRESDIFKENRFKNGM